MHKKKIVIFASGNGTNFQSIVDYFTNKEDRPEIALLIGNKKDAYVFERAKQLQIPSLLINRELFYRTDEVLKLLQSINPDLIVLSGFLWLVPESITRAFSQRIINIHPALLPKYGGKGMYGMLVHQAVVDHKEKGSGISIHYVNTEYDKGDLICQISCEVLPDDTPESLAERIHQLEYLHFPPTIERLLKQ